MFGRPLFWGLFGTKLIASFSLAGLLATKDFKRRLQERYHSTSESYNITPSDIRDIRDARNTVDIDITQFLLDYVINMGPALIPVHRQHYNNHARSDETNTLFQRSRYVEEANETCSIELCPRA
ncbi:hypothetical protein B0J17DRAFT_296055 [Rhizoctonia solani]|nr:hypothetical protein B0J17DRAFT_296055 [Rhizoctonia solani]